MKRDSRALWILAAVAALAAGCERPPAGGGLPIGRPGADIVLRAETVLVQGIVPPHATLDALLRAQNLPLETVNHLVGAVRTVFDPRKLRVSQPFELLRTMDGKIRRFAYEIDAATRVLVEPDPPSGALTAALRPIPRDRHEGTASGAIDRETPSLFEAMDEAGEAPELAIAMAEIFSGEVDFNTELQPGDRFAVAFEKFTRDGRPDTYGDIEAAELQNGDRVLRAFRFAPPGDKAGYYDEQGRSLRRFFLRSPLKFEPRITSGFSRARMHPVLESVRAHLGVDYGAPTGAPVVAVASGRVVSATFDRANGRMVRLRHASGYETYYLHLSAFGPGIRAGAPVSQGQIIGRVGSTGLATGPHLDYRVRKDGVFVNPVKVHASMPPGEPIPAEARAAFEARRDEVLARLSP
ncbi:MAG: M23 family metallopeptidase [Acidobacteria bacterium]|nr:M23 family metallopeptidase [Acidobacteriota bacterium]